jgi:predicted small secreted protein
MNRSVKESFMKKLSVLIAASLVFFLSGCNTVKGVGQDIQKAGEKIEDVAKKK